MTDTATRPQSDVQAMIEAATPLVDHWLLDDIADRDAQTKPITKPEDLPLGRDGTKYDHARWQASEYHLDTHSLALGDRHLLLREVRRLRREVAATTRTERAHWSFSQREARLLEDHTPWFQPDGTDPSTVHVVCNRVGCGDEPFRQHIRRLAALREEAAS